MSFSLRYHPAVGEDIPDIPRNLRRISDAIESRLTLHPHQYGAPLRKTLKGYWKLRAGDYRVVYKLEKDEVLILAIRHRKTVYDDIVRRISHRSYRLPRSQRHPRQANNLASAKGPAANRRPLSIIASPATNDA